MEATPVLQSCQLQMIGLLPKCYSGFTLTEELQISPERFKSKNAHLLRGLAKKNTESSILI